jgi:hypothetical protein
LGYFYGILSVIGWSFAALLAIVAIIVRLRGTTNEEH